MKKQISFYARIALPLLAICMIVAALLSAVNMLTRDIIAANAAEEKRAAVEALYPSFATLTEETSDTEGVNTVYTVLEADGEILGYAVDLTVVGFGGDLNMMVAIRPDGCVGGVRVVSHAETPGFGSRAALPEHLAQYIGLGGSLMLGQDVDAVSGATVSSRAVHAGVNLALSLELGGDEA